MNWGTFDIDNELRIRKKLESMLKYDIELQKNDDKYSFDFCVFRYNTKTNNKYLLGFIEVETSDTWIDEWPSFWKYHSFLARKVFKFDYLNKRFTKTLKDEWMRTIYLIVNHNLTDMFCQSLKVISTFKLQYSNVKNNEYNDYYLRINKNNKKIIHGDLNCKEFIKEFFESQKILDEYDDKNLK